jgi:hypothetical protein
VSAPAAGAAHTLPTMLGHRDRDRWQLLDLVAHRLTDRHVLAFSELVTAVTAIGPMINNPIDRPRRQQRATLALMPRLATLTAPRGVLPPSGRRARRIRARRLGAVTRAAIQPPLKQGDPLALPRNHLRKLLPDKKSDASGTCGRTAPTRPLSQRRPPHCLPRLDRPSPDDCMAPAQPARCDRQLQPREVCTRQRPHPGLTSRLPVCVEGGSKMNQSHLQHPWTADAGSPGAHRDHGRGSAACRAAEPAAVAPPR